MPVWPQDGDNRQVSEFLGWLTGRENGMLLRSAFCGGSESRGHARKRLMQAA